MNSKEIKKLEPPILPNEIWKIIISNIKDFGSIKNLRKTSKWFLSFCEKEILFIFKSITGIPLNNGHFSIRYLMWTMNIICKGSDFGCLIGKISSLRNLQDLKIPFTIKDNYFVHVAPNFAVYVPLSDIGLGGRHKYAFPNFIPDCKAIISDIDNGSFVYVLENLIDSYGIMYFDFGSYRSKQNIFLRTKGRIEDKTSVLKLHQIGLKKEHTVDIQLTLKRFANNLAGLSLFKVRVDNYQLHVTAHYDLKISILLEHNVPFNETTYDFSIFRELKYILMDVEHFKIFQDSKNILYFISGDIILQFNPILHNPNDFF